MSNTVQMGKASLAFHEPVYIQVCCFHRRKKEGETIKALLRYDR